MSDSSDEGDMGKVQSSSRMWAESEPGPSRCAPSRQGYCGYCRVLYSNLDQHLSSLRHLDSVRMSSRRSGTVSTSSSSSSRSKLSLLERFLQDVLQHHPHRYNDPRPSHADLPSVSAPPLPREELDDLRFSDDSRSLDTREHPPSSDVSCQPTNRQEDDQTHSQSGEGVIEAAGQERPSTPIREQQEEGAGPAEHSSHIQGPPTYAQIPPPHNRAPSPAHRKAHRKTNRRKTSDSSSSSPPYRGPDPPSELRPLQSLGPLSCPDPLPGPRPPPQLRPWLSWQRERREAHKEEAFSSDHSEPPDPLDQTIDEVIQMWCHGEISAPRQQDETESFHFSLPVSMETQSDDWDSPVQVALERGHAIADAAGQVSQVEERNLSRLTDVQVDLEDQVYSQQLDFALHSEAQGEGGARQDKGFWTLPIEEVLPTPAHIPEFFRGKSWAQIEREDEERVEKLVQQFRRERFICYFDSESLARYGRRSQNKRRRGENEEADPDSGALPLLDRDEDESAYMRRRRRKRRAFRVASRCQVVKVSHSTQTVQLAVPAVRRSASEVPPTSLPAASQTAAERTPETQTWRCLPPSYSNIITPLQPRTSLVYLLCSPSGPAPADTAAPCSAPKRCRRKRRPLDLSGLKVKYKRLPVRFLDPSSNRILKNAPKGCLWRRRSAPSSPPLPCVRQLFRSLSPDLNADRPPGDGATGSSRVKGSRPPDTTFSHANSFLLSALGRDATQTDKRDTGRRRGRMSQAPPPPPLSRSGRGGGSRPTKRRSRAQATPPQARREGLRRAGPGRKVPGSAIPLHPPSPRRGRARRGRACERSRR